MFKNIGRKIKKLAMVSCWIGILFSIIYFLLIASSDSDLVVPGFIVGALLVLCSLTNSFTLYGFGQLIENSEKTIRILDPNSNAEVNPHLLNPVIT